MEDTRKNEVWNKYYANECKLLKDTVKKAVKYLGIDCVFNGDYTDAYDILSEGLFKTKGDGKSFLDSYDETSSTPLDNWIFSCLCRKLNTYVRDRNADKRKASYEHDSLNEYCSDTEIELINTLASKYNLEEHILEMNEDFLMETIVDKATYYLLKGFKIREVCRILGITKKKLLEEIDIFIHGEKKEEPTMATRENIAITEEKSKAGILSVEMFIDEIDNGYLDFDHPLQRQSEQWNKEQKSNLVTTILNGYKVPSIINAEQIIDGKPYVWCIDGKQRITTCREFINDEFKISKTAERALIHWYEYAKNENGDWLYEDNGSKVRTDYEFNVAGKKFSELPEFLKKKFTKYEFPIEKYLGCSDEDIEFHIRRYNASKVMSAAQKGITHLGRNFAFVTKNIVANSDFIDKCGKYTTAERKNGTLDRMVVESTMAINYLDDWTKKQEDMCEFLKSEATTADFNKVGDVMKELSEAWEPNNTVYEMFNSKDTFIWLTVYSKAGLKPAQFFKFMEWMNEEGYSQRVNGITFEELSDKGSKDKSTVLGKIELLVTLASQNLWADEEQTTTEMNADEVETLEMNTESDEEFPEEMFAIDDDETESDDAFDDQELMRLLDMIEDEESEFKSDDADVNEFLKRVESESLFDIIECPKKIDKQRVALQSLIIVDDLGRRSEPDLSDEGISTYLKTCMLFGSEFDEIEQAIDLIRDDVRLFSDSKIYRAEYIPAVIGIVTKHREDDRILDWLESFRERFEHYSSTETTYECYEYCCENFSEYIENI